MASESRFLPGTKTWEVLVYACEFPGEYTPRTLQDELGWRSFDSLRAMIYKLRKANMLEPAGRAGGRSVHIIPTERGKMFYRANAQSL